MEQDPGQPSSGSEGVGIKEAGDNVIEQGVNVPAPAAAELSSSQSCVSDFIFKRRRRLLGQLMLVSWG